MGFEEWVGKGSCGIVGVAKSVRSALAFGRSVLESHFHCLLCVDDLL